MTSCRSIISPKRVSVIAMNISNHVCLSRVGSCYLGASTMVLGEMCWIPPRAPFTVIPRFPFNRFCGGFPLVRFDPFPVWLIARTKMEFTVMGTRAATWRLFASINFGYEGSSTIVNGSFQYPRPNLNHLTILSIGRI